jgi:hypothetical protein
MTTLDIQKFEAEILGVDAEIFGVDADTLKTAGAGAGELISKAFEMGANKVAADKAKAQAKASEGDVKRAEDARLEATKAAMRATAEKDPVGPLHMAALDAETKARQLEAKVGITSPTAMMPYGQQPGKNPFLAKAGPLPVYGWLLVGAGGIGVIALIAHMMKKK